MKAAEANAGAPSSSATSAEAAGDCNSHSHSGGSSSSDGTSSDGSAAGITTGSAVSSAGGGGSDGGGLVDTIYLDTTYAQPRWTFPAQEAALQMLSDIVCAERAREPATLFVVGSYQVGVLSP